MNVITEWYDNNQRIIIFMVTGRYKWDELEANVVKSREMCASVSHDELVHAIFDSREADGLLPRDAIVKLGRIAEGQASNAGVTVLVTESQLIHQIVDLAQTFYDRVSSRSPRTVRNVFRLAKTITEAEETLLQLDPTLQHLISEPVAD